MNIEKERQTLDKKFDELGYIISEIYMTTCNIINSSKEPDDLFLEIQEWSKELSKTCDYKIENFRDRLGRT